MTATLEKSRTLFEISADLRDIEMALEESDGEITPELEAWFAELTEDRDTKINNYCWLIAELDAHAKFLREEADRFDAWAKTNEKKIEKLKERLMAFFQTHGIQRLVTPHFKPHIQGNGGMQPMTVKVPPTELPEEFQRIEADNDRIREYLEAGGDLPFAQLLPRGSHLRIR